MPTTVDCVTKLEFKNNEPESTPLAVEVTIGNTVDSTGVSNNTVELRFEIGDNEPVILSEERLCLGVIFVEVDLPWTDVSMDEFRATEPVVWIMFCVSVATEALLRLRDAITDDTDGLEM